MLYVNWVNQLKASSNVWAYGRAYYITPNDLTLVYLDFFCTVCKSVSFYQIWKLNVGWDVHVCNSFFSSCQLESELIKSRCYLDVMVWETTFVCKGVNNEVSRLRDSMQVNDVPCSHFFNRNLFFKFYNYEWEICRLSKLIVWNVSA